MADTVLYSSSLSQWSGSSHSNGFCSENEVETVEPSTDSVSSSQQTKSPVGSYKKSSLGILRVRNPTPSPEALNPTVIKKSQRTRPLGRVSSFGLVKSSSESSCYTESTVEEQDLLFTENSKINDIATSPPSPQKRGTITSTNFVSSIRDSHPRVKGQQPLKHWVRQLHQRHLHKKRTVRATRDRMPLCSPEESEDEDGTPASGVRHLGHKKSGSWSSSAFVTTMKSATISLASFPTARRPKSQGSELVGSDGNRRSGIAGTRRSTEGSSEYNQNNDRAAMSRAALRQYTLFEMMSTEASYIEDLKALVSTYRLIMGLMPAESTMDVHRCILGILELHEQLLDRLRELGIGLISQKPIPLRRKLSLRLSDPIHNESHLQKNHQRSKSSNDAYRSPTEWAQRDRYQAYRPTMEPSDAARVADIFNNMLSQFFVYEEYAATYATMVGYLSTSTQQISQWQSYERGLEALINTMAPFSPDNKSMNKPITYGDLLIKPIQRICKYPLLFGDLLKHTPVADDPESHSAIETTLYRLRETTEEINKATTDEYTREKIERSWRLQDMLVFSRTTAAPFPPRSLGRVELCGTLFVAYQSSTTVTGDYMLCALFKSHFLLARPVWGHSCICSFTIVACVGLTDVKLEAADKGKGLLCTNAPFTWKIIFEFQQRVYEIIVCACSEEEEQQWRGQIARLVTKIHDNAYIEEETHGPEQFTVLAMSIEPIGNAFLARRLSIQRIADSDGKLRTRQVIIKNTHPHNEKVEEHAPTPLMKRSQSLLSGSCHTTILCPRRSTRICIEQEMKKVWSTEFLPYPGMTTPRERGLRRSASHVMRKFSKNSLTGSVGKRSFAETSLNQPDDCDSRADLSSLRATTSTTGDKHGLENIPTSSAVSSPGSASQLDVSDQPRVRFTKEVLRKLPRKGSVRIRSPYRQSPPIHSHPKAIHRASSISFEKLGALFRRA